MVTTRAITPTEEYEDIENGHKSTPIKKKVKTVTRFCQDHDVNINQREIFDWCRVKHRTGWRYLEPGADVRRHHNPPYTQETRGRKRKFSDEDFEHLEDWLIDGGFGHRICSWEEIIHEVFPTKQVSEHTIYRAAQLRGYLKCVACQKPYLTPISLEQRHQYLSIRGDRSNYQWRRVRFSEGCHFGLGPRRQLKVIRRRGERYHPDCMQHNIPPKKAKQKNQKRIYVWAAIWYDFKSALVFYETSSSNGKMTSAVYIEKILQGAVQHWINRGDDFILEEDQDSAHGVGHNSQVRRLKHSMGLDYFFNASGSPDLAPIEKIWRAQKQDISDIDHWDDETLNKAVKRAWDHIEMSTINRYIDSMRDRMKSLHDSNDGMTEY